jgi:ribosomal protein S18 acetylase RimI-like enzyme
MSSAVRIRRAEVADAAALAGLAARIFTETFAADTRPDDLAEFLARSYGVRQQTAELADQGIVTLVADDGGRLAAYAQVRRRSPPACVTGEEPVELWRFYVERRWQGSGLAHRLMAAVREVALDLGGRTLWLSVWERNPRAIRFYEKHGFRDVGAEPFWVGSDCQTDRILAAEIRAQATAL